MNAAKQNWPRVKLGEVCEEIRDRVQSAKVPVDCYVTTDNMLQNCAGVVLAEYVPKDVGLVRYQSGDVLLANIRPYLRKLWLSNPKFQLIFDASTLISPLFYRLFLSKLDRKSVPVAWM